MFQKVLFSKLNLILLGAVLCSSESENKQPPYDIALSKQVGDLTDPSVFNAEEFNSQNSAQKHGTNPETEGSMRTTKLFEPCTSDDENGGSFAYFQKSDQSSSTSSLSLDVDLTAVVSILTKHIEAASTTATSSDLKKRVIALKHIVEALKIIYTFDNVLFSSTSIDHILLAVYVELVRIVSTYSISSDLLNSISTETYHHRDVFFHTGMAISTLENMVYFGCGESCTENVDKVLLTTLMCLGAHLHSEGKLDEKQKINFD